MINKNVTSIAYSGSYLPTDVTLLLDIVAADTLGQQAVNAVSEKEQLIQTGQRHYSDMLTLEQTPSAMHEQLYKQALQQGGQRMAYHIELLAATLYQLFINHVTPTVPLVLVSLVRAGLPIGVLLQRALSEPTRKSSLSGNSYHLPSRHYGISIIRDRGLDPVALAHILSAYPQSPVVFIDGWTGKGAIYGELVRSLAAFSDYRHPNHRQIFHQRHPASSESALSSHLDDTGIIPLVTLADPAGVAWLSASAEDWLIPSSVLNSTVSGLISRTLYTKPELGLHRAVFYDNLTAADHSLSLVATIDKLRQQLPALSTTPLIPQHKPRFTTQAIIERLASQYSIQNYNRIKPTIAEATRALLRRDPACVILQKNDPSDEATQLIRYLCQQKSIDIYYDTNIAPYQAVTIIKQR